MGVFSGFHAHFFPLLKHCATRTHEVWDRLYFSSNVDGRTGTLSDGTTRYSFKTMGVAATSGSNAIFTQTTDTGTGNPSADYAVFSGLSGSSKTFTIANASDGMGFAGIQIVQVPEPSAGLLGLCGVSFLLIRRRNR